MSKQQFYTKFIYNVCNNSKTFFSDTTVTSHFQYTYAIVRFVGTQANLKMAEYGGSGPLRFAKPQSCKASLALHASKLQSLKAAKPLWRLTPQSLKAPKPLWRLTPQSLKASKLQSLFGASRFKASKPQSLNAWMLWRFGALAL